MNTHKTATPTNHTIADAALSAEVDAFRAYVATDAGEYVFLRVLNDDKHTDESINVYEAMSLDDGHHDVIACDNATNWVVGSEDDAELNKAHFETLASHDVRWSDILDSDLEDWIEARREEAAK